MLPYAWSCHVCASVNEAATDRCSVCGFASMARGDAILRARTVRSTSSHGATGAIGDRAVAAKILRILAELLSFLP